MKEIVLLVIVFTVNACLADDSVCIGVPDDSHVPFPGDCNKFYVCSGGKATEQWCGNNLHFSPIRHFCQEPSLAECDENVSPTPPTTTPTKPPPPGSCKNARLGQLISHSDCTKYIVCIGNGIVMPCPDKTHFNAKKQVCDHPERAGCQ